MGVNALQRASFIFTVPSWNPLFSRLPAFIFAGNYLTIQFLLCFHNIFIFYTFFCTKIKAISHFFQKKFTFCFLFLFNYQGIWNCIGVENVYIQLLIHFHFVPQFRLLVQIIALESKLFFHNFIILHPKEYQEFTILLQHFIRK